METSTQLPQPSQSAPMSLEQINQQFVEKMERGIFNPNKRFIAGWWNEEDVWQDSLCQVYRDFRSAAQKSHPTDDAALIHGLRLRCFDISHRFTPGKGRRRDPMGRQAQYWDGIECLRFDGLTDEEDGPFDDPGVSRDNPMSFVDTVSFAESYNIEDQLVSHLDLDRWMDRQTEDDQIMLTMRGAGHTLGEIGAAVGCSVSKSSRRLLDLGFDLGTAAELPVPV